MKKIFVVKLLIILCLICSSKQIFCIQQNGKSDSQNLIGFWFQPHSAFLNIKFYPNGRFEFNDYNLKLDKEELLKGRYYLKGSSLVLVYDDRPKQSFNFIKGKGGDKNFYIKKKGYYFVKQVL